MCRRTKRRRDRYYDVQVAPHRSEFFRTREVVHNQRQCTQGKRQGRNHRGSLRQARANLCANNKQPATNPLKIQMNTALSQNARPQQNAAPMSEAPLDV